MASYKKSSKKFLSNNNKSVSFSSNEQNDPKSESVYRKSIRNLNAQEASLEKTQKLTRGRKLEFRAARGNVFDATIEKAISGGHNAYFNYASPYENDENFYYRQNEFQETSSSIENIASTNQSKMEYANRDFWKKLTYSPYPYLNEEESAIYSSKYPLKPEKSETEPQSKKNIESDPNEENWNEKFQICLSKPNTLEQRRLRNLAIHELCNSFMTTAEELVKILISEKSLTFEKKTLKPLKGKGIAGGEKYCAKNIFLKYAVDNHDIYGGDEFAMKAAAHELKGLKAYINCDIENLHFPLFALIDYKGWRVIASSILPIDNATLIYGSEDGGRTFHDDSNEIREKMIQAAKIINIKGHLLETGSTDVTLYSCFDIEGHQGKDGRFYILDTARVFPCETPNSKHYIKGVYLYNLLRPEHVKSEKVPLSSDANFPVGNPFNETEGYNAEVQASTKRLLEIVIPNVALKINSHEITLFDNEGLVVVMHKYGINLRFLGLLRSFVTLPHVRTLMLSEMVSRVVKNVIRKEMRNLTDKTNSEDKFNELVIKFFNQLFGSNSEAKEYWRDIRKILIGKFDYWKINEYLSVSIRSRSSLDSTELEESYDLRKNINKFVLFQSLQQILGVKFKTEINQNMFYDSTLFEKSAPFNVSQIQAIVPIHKTFISEDETVPLLWSYHLREQQKIPIRNETSTVALTISLLHKYIKSLDNLVLDIEKYFGNESPYLPKALIEKTVSFIELDLIELGRKEAEKAEKLCETQIGSNLRWYINYVNILKLISKMAYLQNKPEIAFEYCKRTIELIERIYTNHPLSATIYYEIGIMQHISFETQLENLYKAKNIFSSTYGQNSFDYALAIKAIASIYFKQKKYEDSNKLFSLAYEILKESKSIDSIEILLYLAEINLGMELERVFDFLNQFFEEILIFQRNEIPWTLLIQFFKILSKAYSLKKQLGLVTNYLSLASLISVGLPIKHGHSPIPEVETFIEALETESKLQNIISLKNNQVSCSKTFAQLPPDRQFISLQILNNLQNVEKSQLKDTEKILKEQIQKYLSKIQIPEGELDLTLEIVHYLQQIQYLQRLADILSENGDYLLKLNFYFCCISLIQSCFKYGLKPSLDSLSSFEKSIKEGILKKRSDYLKQSRPRWFVLKENLLYYFKNEGDISPLGYIPLMGASIEPITKKPSFKIFHSVNKEDYLTASNQEECDSWINTLSKIIHEISPDSSSNSSPKKHFMNIPFSPVIEDSIPEIQTIKNPSKQGKIEIKSEKLNSNWMNIYAIIDEKLLKCFDSQKKKVILTIPLQHSICKASKSNKLCFELTTAIRTDLFRVASQQELSEWINAIELKSLASQNLKTKLQNLKKAEGFKGLNLLVVLDDLNSKNLIPQILESILNSFEGSIKNPLKLIPDKKEVIGYINSIENLTEFGKELGLEGLEFDEDNNCILGIDDDFSMHLTYEPNSGRLYIYSPLLDGLPKTIKDRLVLYEKLLEGSMLGGQMAGGGVGVAVKEELILIHCTIEMKDVHPSALRNFARVYVETVEKWRGICHLITNKPKNSCYVHLLEGKDFKNETTYILGSVRPYSTYTTKTQKNTLMPQWNEKFKIYFDSFDTELNITVMSGDLDDETSSKKDIGAYIIKLKELFNKGNEILLPTWVDLTLNEEPTGGKLLIRISELEGDFSSTFNLSEKLVSYEDNCVEYSNTKGSVTKTFQKSFETQATKKSSNQPKNYSSNNWHDRLEELREKEIIEDQVSFSGLERAQQNLTEFGKELSLEGLEFDENNTCILGIDDEFSMHLTYEPNSEKLYLYSPLLDGLPKKPEMLFTLYETLLEGSMLGGQMAGGGVGVATQEELILMHCTIQLSPKASSSLLKNFAPLYVETVEKWRKFCNAIVSGVTPPKEIIITPEKESAKLFSNFSCSKCGKTKLEGQLFYCSHCGEIRCETCTNSGHSQNHAFLVFERKLPQTLSSRTSLLSSSFYSETFSGKISNTNLGLCNYCNFEIWNKLYHCSICPNFNLCESCFKSKRHGTSHVFFYTTLKLDTKKSLDIKLNSFYPEDFLQPQQRFLNGDKSALIAIDDFLKSYKNWHPFMCEAKLELVLFLYENSSSQESYSASIYSLLSYLLTPKKYLNESAFNFRKEYASMLNNKINIKDLLNKLLSQSKQNPYLGTAIGRAILGCLDSKWDYDTQLFVQIVDLVIQFYINATIEPSIEACLRVLVELSNTLIIFPKLCQEAVLNKLAESLKISTTSEILFSTCRLLNIISFNCSVEIAEKLMQLDLPKLLLQHGFESNSTDQNFPFFVLYPANAFFALTNLFCNDKSIFLKLQKFIDARYEEKILQLLVDSSVHTFVRTAALRFFVNIGDPRLILWFIDQCKASEGAMIDLIDEITRAIVFTKNEKFSTNLRANGFIKHLMNLLLVTKNEHLLDSICRCFDIFVTYDENVSKILENNISEINKLSESHEKSLSFCGTLLLVLTNSNLDHLIETKFPQLLDYLENENNRSLSLQNVVLRIFSYICLLSATQTKKLLKLGILKRLLDTFFKLESSETQGYSLGCILSNSAKELGTQIYEQVINQLSEEKILRTDDYAKEISSLPHMIEFIQQNLHKDIRCLPTYVNLALVLLNANSKLSTTLSPCIEKQFDKVFKMSFMNSFDTAPIQSLICYVNFIPSIYLPRLKQANILQMMQNKLEEINSPIIMNFLLDLLYLLITKDASLKEEYLQNKAFSKFIEKLSRDGSIHIKPAVKKIMDFQLKI